MTQRPENLKSMPLYRDVNRIFNELREAGFDNDQSLSVGDLSAFDQYHYHGTSAVDAAVSALGITENSRVLEIGSGIGGPARHLAATTGANIVALELQPDLNSTARQLTQRCNLSNQVEHVASDAMEYSPGEKRFDAIVSWLAFFHIAERAQLLSRCMSWLKPGGGIFVEDLYARGKFTKIEQRDLDVTLYSRYLPTPVVYEKDFTDAGFVDVATVDMSDDWRQFTCDRYDEFCNTRNRQLRVHGEEIVAGLDSFYAAVARLFVSGNLGGIRLIANKTHAADRPGQRLR
jgi:cyclopropane fatty-acyl-phospholipid synthase-like methyltransferase